MPATTDIIKFSEKTFDPLFKGGVVIPFESGFQANKDNAKFKLLDEVIATIPIVIYFRKNSYLVEPFNEQLRAFISAGLIDHWNRLNSHNLKMTQENVGPKVMASENIFCAFQLAFVGWFISFIALLIEILITLMFSLNNRKL